MVHISQVLEAFLPLTSKPYKVLSESELKDILSAAVPRTHRAGWLTRVLSEIHISFSDFVIVFLNVTLKAQNTFFPAPSNLNQCHNHSTFRSSIIQLILLFSSMCARLNFSRFDSTFSLLRESGMLVDGTELPSVLSVWQLKVISTPTKQEKF